jgi:hypothetical protein
MRKIFVTIALILGATMISACERIETGNGGVESFMGHISDKVLPPGNYQTFTKTIYEVNGREVRISFDDLKPKAKGNLTMQDFDVDIYYKIDVEKAAKLMIKFQGDMTFSDGSYFVAHNFIVRQARESVYTAASQFNMETMHEKRPEIARAIKETLQSDLDSDLGKNWVSITSVNIRNIVTDIKMEESIRAIATQQFIRNAEIEAQKTVLETNKRLLIEATGKANAEAEKKLIEANNMAAIKIIEAKSSAEANTLINDSLSPNLLRFREIEAMSKFSDKGPSTILLPTGQSVTPMINVGK